MAERFIDVSEFQPENIDWSKVKKAGYNVILRIGYRGSISHRKICYDAHFKGYLDGVAKAGIKYTVYYFPTPLSDAEADQEAEWLIMNVGGSPLDFPVWLDSERVPGGCANDITTAQRTRYLKRITDALEKAGIPCGIYASTSWLNNQINMETFPQSVIDNTWCAQSAKRCTYDGTYALWQYGKTRISGINDDVDISVKVGDFNMTCAPKKQTADPIDVILEIAAGEVRYHEKASASSLYSKTGNSGSRNYTKYNKELHELQPKNMDYPAAWCDAFVDWCVWQTCKRFGKGADAARKVLCGDFDDYTYSSVNYYKKASRWTQTPHRGDQIFFGGSGHTGIVTKVSGNTVYTIEGNKSDAVRECSYNKNNSNIIGYGRPRYDLIGTVLSNNTTTDSEEYDMPQLKRGSKGKAVKILQIILGGLDVDGSFGPLTEKAVKAFQKAHSLEQDGVVGPLTWKALLNTL